MRSVAIIVGITFLLVAGNAIAGTILDFWHSYIHAQTRQTHCSFNLAQYKRGLFFGSCGPSTKSRQWSYNFDLAGDGPIYPASEIRILDDNGKPAHVVSGQVVTDLKLGTAQIAIEVESGGTTNKFVGNGEYRIIRAR